MKISKFPTIKIITALSICVVFYFQYKATKYAVEVGYENGYRDASQVTESHWKSLLIDKDFACYNSKTGKWQLQSLEDVATTATILGKTKLVAIIPEPPVDVSDIKEILAKKKR